MSWNLDVRVRSAMISDSLDVLGIRNNAMDTRVHALRPGMRVVGIAATAEFMPDSEYDQKDPYGDAIDFLDTLAPGEAAVIATGGQCLSAFWGELFSAAAKGRGATGVVTDGPLRDTEQIVGIGFSAFGQASRPYDYKGRMRLKTTRQQVICGGVSVNNGDGVIADSDGVVIVPAEHLAAVTELANARAATEKTVLQDLLAGKSVREVWNAYGVL
jgi:4-hydroxy-4-methyl-2-oxoglutarate aldolase